MKHSLKITKTESGTKGLLSLWGDMTLSHARETRDILLEAIKQVDTLHLDLHEIESADVSLVQLICATHRECVAFGKNIVLQDGAGNSMRDLLQRAGYCKQLGCPSEAKTTCLWEKVSQR